MLQIDTSPSTVPADAAMHVWDSKYGAVVPVGYVQVMPVVYCGLFPTDAEQFEPLREALGRLQLNDAALQFEPEVRTLPYFLLLHSL